MGNNLFGANISGVLAQALGPGLLPATLIKVTEGSVDPNNITGPKIGGGEVSYSCRGFIEDYNDSLIDGTRIEQGDKKVMLLGDTIASGKIPEQSDRVVIEGIDRVIIGPVKRDPDAATYILQVRQ